MNSSATCSNDSHTVGMADVQVAAEAVGATGQGDAGVAEHVTFAAVDMIDAFR